MKALPLLAIVFCVSCGPSATQVAINNVARARADAHHVAGARQAEAYADAVHRAYLAGAYKNKPSDLQADVIDAITILDHATGGAGGEAALLVAWRGVLFADFGKPAEALAELKRSFDMAPNELAAKNLVLVYGAANKPDEVGRICAATAPTIRIDDDKLAFIEHCRKNMNAITPEGEMAWMSSELVAWYQAENARRLGAEIEAEQARERRQQEEQRVVRQTEQCAATCKEDGLTCQNDCYGDKECEDRCVEINHACLDRCESSAYEKLGY